MEMLVALFSLVGYIIGAALQYYFTRLLDTKQHYRDLRTNAYLDYLGAVAEQTNTSWREGGLPDGHSLARVADAKCRICLYGSSAAIRSFAEFEKAGASIANYPEKFTEMVAVMRKDSTKEKTDSKDLRLLLMGRRDS